METRSEIGYILLGAIDCFLVDLSGFVDAVGACQIAHLN